MPDPVKDIGEDALLPPELPPGWTVKCQVCGTVHEPEDSILCRVCGEPVIVWGWAP